MIEEKGPFDGLLGFSQGAAVAALHCAVHSGNFKFVIVCSGFMSKAHNSLFKEYINIPSLHVFGGGGKDKQVSMRESELLADKFDPATRVILRHDQGHIIPSSKTYVQDYIRFLSQYV